MQYTPVNNFQYDNIKPAVCKQKRRKGASVLWSDNIVTFDIETTNLFKWPDGTVTGFDDQIPPARYKAAQKAGYMIVWQATVDGDVVIGRTWDEFEIFLRQLREKLGARFIIWIHNLSFEFAFLRNLITDMQVFAREPLRPLRAYSPEYDVEFRDTLILTNSKLEGVPDLFHLDVRKAVGKWDYDKVRTPLTELTDDEIEYAAGDVIVTDALVQHFKGRYKNLYRIPMTNTSILRKECFDLYKDAYYTRCKIANQCETDPVKYRFLKWAFSGGYAHANADLVGKLLQQVGSYDEASAYPAQMVARRFPWGKFEPSEIKRSVDMYNPNFAHLFHVQFINITSRLSNHYISFSRCLKRRGTYNDNGRIVMADMVEMVITDVDMDIIRRAYMIGEIRLLHVWSAPYRYLDTRYVNFILNLYKQKTEWKGLPEYEDIYSQIKVKNNSTYGMMVTDVVRDDVVFAGNQWLPVESDDIAAIAEKLQKVANPNKCFLSYAWGVWVTAWARWSLWQIILAPGCDEAIVYNDTDSVKFSIELSHGAVEAAVARYNAQLTADMRKALLWHGLDTDLAAPKDRKGNPRPLGHFEYEATYKEFRTWGSKKYAYRDSDDSIHTTVAGVSKTYRDADGTKHVKLQDLKDFKPGLTWDYRESGRTTAYYNESQPDVTVDGYTFTQRFGVCVMATTYTLGVTGEFDTFVTAAQKSRDHTGSGWLDGCARIDVADQKGIINE
jgi:hypothetical protein